MKKIFLFAAAFLGLSLGLASCEDDPKNPGDTSIKSEFGITGVKSLVSGQSFDFKVKGERDTTYMYRHVKTDTLIDPTTGEFLVDKEGYYVTKNDTTYLPGTGRCRNGRVIEIEPIIRKWSEDENGTIDTLRFEISSNSRWKMLNSTITSASGADYSVTNDKYDYYKPCDGTDKGGGNGHIDIKMNYLGGNQVNVIQPIMTNDSAVLYIVRFQIRGKNYKEI